MLSAPRTLAALPLLMAKLAHALAEVSSSLGADRHIGYKKVYYTIDFTDSIMPCPDFVNKHVKADSLKLGLTPGDGDEPDSFGLNGFLNLSVPIDADLDMQLEICKETEVLCEPMFSAQTNICQSIKEEDVPWFILFMKMNVNACPIPEGNYSIKDMVMSTEPYKSCLSREFCGNYAVTLKVMNKVETIACHIAYMEVLEKQCK